MLRAVLRGVLTSALRAPDVAPPVVSFSPVQLFANGEQGGWWDPSDFSTLFQDSAGTTPVAAAGQPVGLIRDKSGRGNHLSQGTAASRPTLQQDASGFWYLNFDGVDDSLATAGPVNFSSTAQVSFFCGALKASDAAGAVACELGASVGVTAGSFGFFAPNGATATFAFAGRGATATSTSATTATFAAPVAVVATGSMNLAVPQTQLRLNGAVAASNAAATGGGTIANDTLYVGRRAGATSPFNGRLYSLIARGAASTATQIAQTERFVGSKMGIAL